VKPANVLVDEGQAVLTDFGIARESRAATDVLGLSADSTWLASARGDVIAGTSAYMAPEQWQRAPIDGRVDIYALGGLLHAMLTGRPPYLRDNPLAMRDAHLHAPPPSPTAIVPGLPPAFDAVVRKAMAKDPDHRYLTGDALASAAKAALDGGGISPAAGAGAPGSGRRIAVRAIAVMCVLTALVVGTTTATRPARDRDKSSRSQAGGPVPEAASGAPSTPTEPAPLGVVFQDDFSGFTGAFEAADGADGSAQRTDGRFRMTTKARNARFTSVSTSAPLRGNIRIDADAVRLGDVPAGFGVSCRLNTRSGVSHYMAEIGRTGTWRILRYDGSDRPGTSLKAHAAPDPPPPQNVPVHVGLECNGSDVPGTLVVLKLHVDGALVGTVSDLQGLSVGSVGLTAIGYSGVPADVRFDNVVVTRS
jgi:hypothetical protein